MSLDLQDGPYLRVVIDMGDYRKDIRYMQLAITNRQWNLCNEVTNVIRNAH